jgi:hypothetical protein
MIVKKITENYNGTDIIFKQDNKGFFWIDFNDFVALTEGLYNYSTLLAWIKKHRQFRNHFYSYHNMEPGCRGLTLSFNEYGVIACLLYLNTTELSDAASWVASILQSYRFPPSAAGLKDVTLQPEYNKKFGNKNLEFFSDRQNQLWARLTDVCSLVNVEYESIYGYYIMNPDEYSSYLNEHVTGKVFNDFTGVNEYGIIAMPLLLDSSYEIIDTIFSLAGILKTYRLSNIGNTKEVSI